MKKFFFGILLSTLLFGCIKSEPKIIAGHEWNAVNRVVADTSSELLIWKPFIVQLDYGKNFDFDSLLSEFIDESGKRVFSHKTAVSSKTGSYTVQGKKNGKEMTGKDYFHSKKEQTVKVRFSTSEKVILERELRLITDR